MTYTKQNKTLNIFLKDIEDIERTLPPISEPEASLVLGQFERKEDLVFKMEVEGIPATVEVPFHAVEFITWTVESAEVTKDDPYGCESEE